jgi:hypothetical protein
MAAAGSGRWRKEKYYPRRESFPPAPVYLPPWRAPTTLRALSGPYFWAGFIRRSRLHSSLDLDAAVSCSSAALRASGPGRQRGVRVTPAGGTSGSMSLGARESLLALALCLGLGKLRRRDHVDHVFANKSPSVVRLAVTVVGLRQVRT